MPSTLVTHQRIHLNNPNINYIRTENCAYCKYEKRKSYRTRYRTRYTSVPSLDYYSVIEFSHRYNPYNYTYYNINFNYKEVERTNKPLKFPFNIPSKYAVKKI